jgi:hypothetical protein
MPFASPAAPAEYFRHFNIVNHLILLLTSDNVRIPRRLTMRLYSAKSRTKLDRIAIFLRGSERGGFRLVMQVLERVF